MALWVLVGHTSVWAGATLPILGGAGFAVDGFILLSGFLMTYHYRIKEAAEPWESPSTWFSFWTKRFFRIAPLYYLCLLVYYSFSSYWISAHHQIDAQFPAAWASQENAASFDWFVSPAHAILHLSFLFGVLPRFCSSAALPDWSLSLEMQFYAVFPFLMLLVRKKGWQTLAIVTLIACFIAKKLFGVYVTSKPGLLGIFPQPSFLPLKAVLFLAGMLMADAYIEIQSGKLGKWLYFLGSIALCGYFADRLVVLMSSVLVALFIGGQRSSALMAYIKAFLESRPLKFTGDISYSIYLIHMMILLASNGILTAHSSYAGHHPLVRFAILGAIAIPVTYLVAWFTYRWIEKPGIRLGKVVAASIKQMLSANSPGGAKDKLGLS